MPSLSTKSLYALNRHFEHALMTARINRKNCLPVNDDLILLMIDVNFMDSIGLKGKQSVKLANFNLRFNTEMLTCFCPRIPHR